MKKLLVVFMILAAFIAGGLTTYFYQNNNKDKTVLTTKIVKDEIFTIDKTNFNTYSEALLTDISKCTKNEKRLDVKAEQDLQIYISTYHGESFYTSNNKMTKDQKSIAEDVHLASLNLTYLLEAIQDNNTKDIKVQHKILTDLLKPYNL